MMDAKEALLQFEENGEVQSRFRLTEAIDFTPRHPTSCLQD